MKNIGSMGWLSIVCCVVLHTCSLNASSSLTSINECCWCWYWCYHHNLVLVCSSHRAQRPDAASIGDRTIFYKRFIFFTSRCMSYCYCLLSIVYCTSCYWDVEKPHRHSHRSQSQYQWGGWTRSLRLPSQGWVRLLLQISWQNKYFNFNII